MKTGLTLTQLANELERQQSTKKDFVAPASALEMLPDLRIALKDTGEFTVRDYAHGQIANYTAIPKQYYDRCKTSAPALLASQVNHWLGQQPNDKRLVRTLEGSARAFLSHRYRPLDNFDLAEAALPILMGQGQDMRIESSALTDTRMYLKAVTARLQADVKVGDTVQAGIVISNSEVGAGSVKVEPMIFRLVCLNGMIAADASLRKYHVGRGFGDNGDDVAQFFRDETRAADDKAFFLKVQDIIKAAFSEAMFNSLVNKMREAAGAKISGDPIKVVEVTAKKYQLSEGEKGSVLRNLIEGRDLSLYGLMNAITATSQDETIDYERATDLERLGGQIIELPASEWKELSAAA